MQELFLILEKGYIDNKGRKYNLITNVTNKHHLHEGFIHVFSDERKIKKLKKKSIEMEPRDFLFAKQKMEKLNKNYLLESQMFGS